MVKDKIRFVAVSVFLSNIGVLLTVLLILLTMTTRNDNVNQCEMTCIHRTQCGCRLDILKSYLKQAFGENFHNVEVKRKLKHEEKRKQHNSEYGNVRTRHAIWSIKPIARLSGSNQIIRQDEEDKPMVPIRKWKTEKRSCYVRNGMEYRNGRLVVPVPGYYHVYSFLDLFRKYCDGNGNTLMTDIKRDAAIKIAIFKFNIKSGRDEEVLSTYKPYQHSMNGHFNFYETFISSDVKLDAGDEVYLKVSNITYIKNPSKNFFGIHML